ncbi:MAG: hypothetical protein AAGC70_02940 [Pseudomonadota bacterium]
MLFEAGLRQSGSHMAHNISALITRGPLDETPASEFDLPLITVGDFVIVPLYVNYSDHWAEKLGMPRETHANMAHDAPITLEFARQLNIARFALIQTEYFGGFGEQFATVYAGNQRMMAVTKGGINDALRMIGVVRQDGMDEFDSMELGKYREFSTYFKAYWPSR